MENDEVVSVLRAQVNLLVDDSSSVVIKTSTEGGATTVKVIVPSAEIGKLVGKQGRTARALRLLMSAGGKKAGRVYSLDIQGQPAAVAA